MRTGNERDDDRPEPRVVAIVVACVAGAALIGAAYALISWLL